MFGRQRVRSGRSRLEAIVDRLELPDDWTIEEFFDSLERVRGRRIVRIPLPDNAPVELCGLWFPRRDDDIVFYRASGDVLQVRHVIGHEAAHVLLDHGSDRESTPAELAALLTGMDLPSDIDLSTARAARGVSSYAHGEEYEAELLATIIMARARRDGDTRRDRLLKAF